MRKPLKQKNEIVSDLSKVFRTYGFDGATITRLTNGTGLERASLYHHFPNGKTDMAEAVLLKALDDLKIEVVDRLNDDVDAETKINSMIDAVDKFYNHGNEVCFITIFSLAKISKSVTDGMSSALRLWLKLLEKALDELKISKPKESAQQALATIQGALILSNTIKDPKIFRNSLRQLKSQWLN